MVPAFVAGGIPLASAVINLAAELREDWEQVKLAPPPSKYTARTRAIPAHHNSASNVGHY